MHDSTDSGIVTTLDCIGGVSSIWTLSAGEEFETPRQGRHEPDLKPTYSSQVPSGVSRPASNHLWFGKFKFYLFQVDGEQWNCIPSGHHTNNTYYSSAHTSPLPSTKRTEMTTLLLSALNKGKQVDIAIVPLFCNCSD